MIIIVSMDSSGQANHSQKNCYKCKQTKSTFEFGSDKSRYDGKQPVCKACVRLIGAEYRANNKEKRKAIVDKYRAANREKCNLATKLSNQKHPETQRKWVEKNREKVRETKRNWAARHSEQNKEIKINNKAKRRGAFGNHTPQQITDLLHKQKHKCACCKTDISDKFHRDHIIPISAGGTNEIFNIQLLCAFCNTSKGAKDPITFMQQKGFLL